MISKLEREGYPIQSIDVDQRRDLANKYGVSGIPCVVLIIDGKMVQKSTYGSSDPTQPNEMLKEMLTKAQNARLAARQKPKGQPKQLDGGTGSGSENGTEIKLVSQQNKSGFSFPFGLNGKPQQTATVGTSQTSNTNRQQAAVTTKTPVVRIKVYDKNGINFGSGTIIESTRDRCTILSCQHIFRDTDASSKIEVDIFGGKQATTFPAKLIKTNANADLSLLELSTHHRFTSAKIASLTNNPKEGDHVFSLGCGGGRDPEKFQTRVTGVNRYKGPDTLDCSGSPEQGRSGGGLFNLKNELVAVCFGDQASDNRGIYSGLKPIYQLLDEAKLSYLHPVTNEASQPDTQLAETQPFGTETNNNAIPDTSIPSANSGSLEAKLELIKAALAQAGDAEVICIVRPKNSPTHEPKVMIINQASPKLIGYLQNDTQQAPTSTIQPAMKQVPNNFSATNQQQPTAATASGTTAPQGFAPIPTESQAPNQNLNNNSNTPQSSMPQPLTNQPLNPFSTTNNSSESPWGNSPF